MCGLVIKILKYEKRRKKTEIKIKIKKLTLFWLFLGSINVIDSTVYNVQFCLKLSPLSKLPEIFQELRVDSLNWKPNTQFVFSMAENMLEIV